MGKPEAPTPPNPYATAAAQTGTNVATAVANANLGQVNQFTPQGSVNYSQSGNYNFTDPVSGQNYNIPKFTSTQAYSIDPATYLRENPDVLAAAQASGMTPEAYAQQHWANYGQAEGRAASGEAGLYNTGLQTRQNLADIANTQTQRVGNLLSTPFNPSTGAPVAGNAQMLRSLPYASMSYDTGGPVQTSFGDAGDITKSYGAGDFSQDRQNVEDSLMARMNPQLAIEKQGITQQLADQGIRPGSQAYSDAMMNYSRQANDARFGAISQAGSEQQRMMDMAAQRAGFQNAAQQQQYEQQLGRGSFANQAQSQQNQQNAALAAFGNAGLAQRTAQEQSAFNAENSARNQYMQEQYQQRNQPLNEISALMSGSQVQQPNWLNSPTSQIPTTDFAGIQNANTQAQMAAYNTAQSGWNSTIGGVLGLGAGALKGGYISDRREKENITKMGTVFAADSESSERKQLPIYQYSYKKDPASVRHIGPMAQDVEKITPEAVGELEGGVKYIKPQRLMGSILRAG